MSTKYVPSSSQHPTPPFVCVCLVFFARLQISEVPSQLLFVGREGTGKSTLFASLQRVFPVLEGHTNLGVSGIRQLGLQELAQLD